MEKIASNFVTLPPLTQGDKVAVLSPAGDAASYFPWVLDQGLARLRNELSLIPIEFPTTRMRSPSPQERAHDVNAAFGDPDMKAIFTTLGGNDQVTILPFLDEDVIRTNPKPFFGYSDNTNIIQYLWNLRIPAYYGGAIMTQFAMQGEMFDITVESLRQAAFEKGEHEVVKSRQYVDIDLDWADKNNLSATRELEASEDWFWDGRLNTDGRLWGGCVESLLHYLDAGWPVPDFGAERIVVYLESAENLPEASVVKALIDTLADKGIFKAATAVLVGRPKAWDFNKPLSEEARKQYRAEQRQTIVRTVRDYAPYIPIIQGMDFGHTDPQIVVPSGNLCRIDGDNQKVYFTY